MRSSCRLATLLFSSLLCSPLLLWLPASVAADALWLREPALSPDGKQLAFTWQGRIFVASAEGGPATALTGSDYLSQRPVWSPDGKRLAFAANLYGNEDVFVVPASGGEMVRLTRDSRSDLPQVFSADGKRLLLSSQRPGPPRPTILSRKATNGASSTGPRSVAAPCRPICRCQRPSPVPTGSGSPIRCPRRINPFASISTPSLCPASGCLMASSTSS